MGMLQDTNKLEHNNLITIIEILFVINNTDNKMMIF